MVLLKRFAIFTLLTIFLVAGGASASTHYIAANGSDANDGMTKSTPWAHAPRMPGASANANSYSPAAGDNFIFMGCDTWTFNAQWSWNFSGSSGNNIVLGVDRSWWNTSVCPSAWNRPIFSGGGTFPGTASGSTFMLSIGGSYVEVAFIEFTGLFYNSVGSSTEIGYITKSGSNVLIHDSYFHGWAHAPGASENENTNAIFCQGSATGSRIYNNAFDGWDTDKQSFGGIYSSSGCGEVDHNYFAYQNDAMNFNNIQLIHDNTFYNAGTVPYPGSGDHNNAMESNSDNPGGMLVYNNYYVLNNGGPACGNGCGVAIQIAPPSGTTSYFFNNVISNGPSSGNGLMCEQSISNPGGTCFIFNNTEECGPDAQGAGQSCLRIGGLSGTLPLAALTNNHLITSTGPIAQTTPVVQTLATANGQGYAMAQTFNFSPTSSGGATIGSGTNMSAICARISSINAAAGAACLNDTAYGVAYSSTTHTITGSARTPVARPTIGAWDVGAYQFGGQSAAKPNPPTNLAATVQ